MNNAIEIRLADRLGVRTDDLKFPAMPGNKSETVQADLSVAQEMQLGNAIQWRIGQALGAKNDGLSFPPLPNLKASEPSALNAIAKEERLANQLTQREAKAIGADSTQLIVPAVIDHKTGLSAEQNLLAQLRMGTQLDCLFVAPEPLTNALKHQSEKMAHSTRVR